MRRIVPVDAVSQVIRPLLAAGLAALLEWGLLHALTPGAPALVVSGSVAGGMYAIAVAAWERDILGALAQNVLPVRARTWVRWYVPAAQG